MMDSHSFGRAVAEADKAFAVLLTLAVIGALTVAGCAAAIVVAVVRLHQ